MMPPTHGGVVSATGAGAAALGVVAKRGGCPWGAGVLGGSAKPERVRVDMVDGLAVELVDVDFFAELQNCEEIVKMNF